MVWNLRSEESLPNYVCNTPQSGLPWHCMMFASWGNNDPTTTCTCTCRLATSTLGLVEAVEGVEQCKFTRHRLQLEDRAE